MARTIWKGAISFGLVSIPVRLFSAVQDKSVKLHLLTKDGRCRLGYKLYCTDTGKEYQYADAVRGAEVGPNNYVVITDEELESIKPKSGRSIDILDFVNLEEIDPLFFEKPYYLGPDERGTKPYFLLLKAMQDNKKVALAKFVMRQKEYLAVLRPLESVLCLETMHYKEEVVDEENIISPEEKIPVSTAELKMANQLIDAMTNSFTPEKYKDDYKYRVEELIEQKAEGKQIVIHKEKQKKKTEVINLVDALRDSVKLRQQEAKKKKGKKSA